MIETANLRKLRHLEFCQTIEVICNMLNEREIPEGEVKELVQRLMQELQIFRNHLSYRKTGKLTSELKAIRKRRIAAYRSLAGQVRSLKLLPVPRIAQAAAELYALIEDCGKYPYRKPELQKAQLMSRLVEHMQQKYNTHVGILGLQCTVDCLKELNEEYELLFNKWMEAIAIQREHVLLPQRVVIQTIFQRLCELVNAAIIWNDEKQPYEQMAQVIDEVVKKARWALKHRMAMRKEEDGDTEVD